MVDMVNYVLIKYGGNTLAIECFKDHPGQPLEVQSYLYGAILNT